MTDAYGEDRPPLLDAPDLVKRLARGRTLVDAVLGRPAEAVHAVDGVSFTLARDRTLGLVGESGCGKTTLGRLILRLHDADGGEVRLDGLDLLRLSDAELVPCRRRIQVTFQAPHSSLTPRQ